MISLLVFQLVRESFIDKVGVPQQKLFAERRVSDLYSRAFPSKTCSLKDIPRLEYDDKSIVEFPENI